MINEITIIVATENMLYYTDLLTPVQQDKAGWISLGIFVFQIGVNFLKMVYVSVMGITERVLQL